MLPFDISPRMENENIHTKKRILCFGDSNTWGQVPLKVHVKKRYPENVRWTGILQNILGNQYQVIEEGLNGRTTGLDDGFREGRNARAYLPPCLDSHVPFDFLIIMLGTNDLKPKFKPDSKAIADRMRELIRISKSLALNENNQTCQILLIAPLIPKLQYTYEDFKDSNIESNAKTVNQLYRDIAKTEGTLFLDASEIIEASQEDGAHIDPVGHQQLAKAISSMVLLNR
jgi:lysophospholipase L1-like esterase